MVACIFYIMASMAMVIYGHTDHKNGFVLNQRFQANLDTCNCPASHNLHVMSHPDFYNGALLEHPIIGGDYVYHVANELHSKGYFTKAETSPGAGDAMAVWSMKDEYGAQFWVIGNDDQRPTDATSLVNNPNPKVRAIAKTMKCPHELTDEHGVGDSAWRFTHDPHQTLIAGKSLIVYCKLSEGCAEECALDTENILGDTCSGSTCICAGMARHAGTACDAKNADRCSITGCMCGSAAACSGNSDTCTSGTCMCGSEPECVGAVVGCVIGSCV